MTIQSEYDPLKISEITREKIEARNNRTAPVLGKAVLPSNTSNSSSKHEFREAEDNLKNEFLGMLMGTNSSDSSVIHNNSDPLTFETQNHGTNEFFLPHNKCEVRKKDISDSEFNFSIINSVAGEVRIKGEFTNGKCLVRLSMKSTLSVKEKSVLAQILQTSLASKLNTEMELKID